MYRKRREELLIKSRIDGDKKAEVIREQSIKLTHLLQQEKEAKLEQVYCNLWWRYLEFHANAHINQCSNEWSARRN